jgi:hypothetical protein
MNEWNSIKEGSTRAAEGRRMVIVTMKEDKVCVMEGSLR